jgi:O-antigen/teichoic acid export membrane protein
LNQSELALWWIFLALGALANLADFGFGQMISRVYGYLWAGAEDIDVEGVRQPLAGAKPNFHRIHQLDRAVRYLYWRISLIATILLGVGGTLFLMKPVRALTEPSFAWLAWTLFLCSFGYGLATTRWTLACQGVNRVRALQAAILWSGLAYVVSAAALLTLGAGLMAIVVATTLRAALGRYFCRIAYREAVPAPGYEAALDLGLLKRLWPNARKFGVIAFGSYLIFNGGVLLSSQFLGDEITASYGLTAQIGTFLMNFAGLWLTVKWPEITILRTQGKTFEMGTLFARRLAFVLASFLVMSIALVIFGNQLLALKGTQTRLLSTPYLAVYLVYLTQQLLYIQFATLTFTENVVPFFKISLFTGVGLICLSLILTPRWGLWGLLVAPLIAELACSAWYPVLRGFRGQPLSLRQFARAAFLGHV